MAGNGMISPAVDNFSTRRGEYHYRWRGGNPKPDPARRRANSKASSKRYPERRRAREKVKDAVRCGLLAPVKTQPCFDCGNNAQAYDHFEGYDKPLSVQATCFKCHARRGRERGEHKLNGRLRRTPSLKSEWVTSPGGD